MAEYRLNDWDSFKFPIISLNVLDKGEIINNIETKIENKDAFTDKELLELALTPILEKDKESIINQFHQTKDLMSKIEFPNEEIKTSVYGIVLMLSSMYFEELDPIRKDIQGDLMGKVDCVTEAIEERLNGRNIEIAITLLEIGKLSFEDISKSTGLSVDKIRELDESL